MDNALLSRLVAVLGPVPGVMAIVLGGSRARGTAGPASDYDIGLYYQSRRPIDVPALRHAVAAIVDDPALTVTEIGAWGPWIDGGGWLTIAGVEVDLLYRDIDKVAATYAELETGRFRMDYQVGHPHGFCSAILAGEAALALPLHDPSGAFAALAQQVAHYPRALRDALVARFGWEIDFAIENGELAARRGEQTHVVGCAYRAVCCIAQVLFALNERYLINEKGAVSAAADLPVTIDGLNGEVDRVWREVASGAYAEALARLSTLSLQLKRLVEMA